MVNVLEGLSKCRENYIWLAAEVMAERTFSIAVMFCVNQGETLDKAKDILESLLKDPQQLRFHMSDEIYLVEGATDSDLDLLFDDYLPALLKNQIEFLEQLPELPQPTNEVLSTELAAVRKRKIGFIH